VAYGRGGRVGHPVVRVLVGVGGGVAGLAAAAYLRRGQVAEVAEVTLETGVGLPGRVGPVGFGEGRVRVGPVLGEKGEVAAPVA
jgi:hypothetical protein